MRRTRGVSTARPRAEVTAVIAEVGAALMRRRSTAELLADVGALVCSALGCGATYTLLWHADEDVFQPAASHGYSSERWTAMRAAAPARRELVPVLARLATTDMVGSWELPHGAHALLAPQRAPVRARAAANGHPTLSVLALRRGTTVIGLQVSSIDGRRARSARVRRIARGIAPLISMALEHARLVEELEHASRLRSEFVASMSHELRTPLNVVLGYLDLLADGDFGALSAEQLDVLGRVEHSARELLDLVNATLSVSRLEAGRHDLEVSDVAVGDVLSELEHETHMHNAHGIRVIRGAAIAATTVRTDRGKLKLVLKNLLTNALKFTERGEVRIEARAGQGGVELTVADTGIGIQPAALPIIFDPFRQADSSTTRRYGGVGLGLYIVHRVVAMLGGTITVDSEPGRGSTFRLWLPRIVPIAAAR